MKLKIHLTNGKYVTLTSVSATEVPKLAGLNLDSFIAFRGVEGQTEDIYVNPNHVLYIEVVK